MTKTLPLLALALVTVPVAASAAEPTRFTRDGQSYVYTSERKGDATVLTGRMLSDGRDFVFTVRGKRVTGTIDNLPVSFVIDRPLDAPTELSQR